MTSEYGLNDLNLMIDIEEELNKYFAIKEKLDLYEDVKEFLDEIHRTKTYLSERKAEILGKNIAEFFRNSILLEKSYERISVLVKLCKKHFPNSKILKESNLEEKIKELAEINKSEPLIELLAHLCTQSLKEGNQNTK